MNWKCCSVVVPLLTVTGELFVVVMCDGSSSSGKGQQQEWAGAVIKLAGHYHLLLFFIVFMQDVPCVCVCVNEIMCVWEWDCVPVCASIRLLVPGCQCLYVCLYKDIYIKHLHNKFEGSIFSEKNYASSLISSECRYPVNLKWKQISFVNL